MEAFRNGAVPMREEVSSRRILRAGRLLLAWGTAIALFSCGGDQLIDPDDPGAGDPDPDPPDPGAPAGISVSMQADLPDRMELADSVVIHVEAEDPEGTGSVARMGFSAVVRVPGSSTELARTDEEVVNGQPGQTVSRDFVLRSDGLSAEDLPREITVELYGWALNSQDACAAVAYDSSSDSQECDSTDVAGETLRVAATPATEAPVLVVPGRTTLFQHSSVVVGDLQVDTLRERAYVSNRESNRLHVLDVASHEWADDVLVGAEPWGLHLNADGDTLLVANSGGTSVSHVRLSGTPEEVVSRRLQTRNTALFEIGLLEEEVEDEDEEDERPTLAGEVRFMDFSDRPQYVAQDEGGRILYSTRPTGAAPDGTVRLVERQAGWSEHETRILARIPLDTRSGEGTLAVMNVDSIVPYLDGLVEIWDHTPGAPDQTIRSGILPPLEAAAYMATETSSDIDFVEDRAWDLQSVSFSDTTYVAASGDRRFVAFGDGGEPGVGRVVVWHSPTATIQRRLTVADLVHNASERVRALELNHDGSLGVARGELATYFFSNDLRLRGTVPESLEGGGGAALHPDHPNTAAPSAPGPSTLAFTVNGDREIRILDTVHYVQRGVIPIRDALVGPMRVTPPLPSDNDGQGRDCSGSSCVVAKVYAVTDGGGVVVVDVRASDIEESQ
ncbi:MAG: YncE family protein [bacterium]